MYFTFLQQAFSFSSAASWLAWAACSVVMVCDREACESEREIAVFPRDAPDATYVSLPLQPSPFLFPPIGRSKMHRCALLAMKESRTHTVGECDMYKEERDVLEEMREIYRRR